MYQKKKRIKLKPSEYRKMKTELYNRAKESCEICGRWVEFAQFHVHHIKTRGAGGDDSLDNCQGLCFKCHRAIHDGNL